MTEAVVQSCPVKKVFLKFLQNSQENTCSRISFLIKLQTSGNFIEKEALAQVFSSEFCKIFMNTFSRRTPLVAASSETHLGPYQTSMMELSSENSSRL